MRVLQFFLAAMMASPCLAQTVDKVEIFPAKDVTSKLAALVQEAKSSGSSGATLGIDVSPAIKLSVRTASGGAEIHGRFDDLFVVTEGRATLITGGEIANPQTGKDGETKGATIQNGVVRTISKGDIVHIPAGTPHQLIIASGDIFETIVIKTAH